MKQRGRKSTAQLEVLSFQPPPSHRSLPVFKPPSPPDHLGEPERKIWREIFEEYETSTRLAVDVLRSGLESHQRARECREQIAKDGLTVEGRDGQLRSHPLISAERDSRAAFIAAIKALGLEL